MKIQAGSDIVTTTTLAGAITSYVDECLLWVTQWGVWPSSENFHVFYRVRESYGERRLLYNAPGHLFLKHETADLQAFVESAFLCGWDFYLLPAPDYEQRRSSATTSSSNYTPTPTKFFSITSKSHYRDQWKSKFQPEYIRSVAVPRNQ